MRVLLTNDDGIRAPGLLALAEAFSGAGHAVAVCAPDRQRSASSHAITMGKPLRAASAQVPGADLAWWVDGTPADCASLGLFLLGKAGADLVVSGINCGMNQGGACIYSGTVGAALEGAMCGCQALAVSLCVSHEAGKTVAEYRAAARTALRVAEWALAHPLPRGVIYNLNVPPLPYEALKGVAPGRLAPVFLEDPLYEQVEGGDGQGQSYRYLGAGPALPLDDPDYDTNLTAGGFASLTKLTWDFRLGPDPVKPGDIQLW